MSRGKSGGIVAALATEDFVVEAQPGRGVRIGPGLARIAASISSDFTLLLHPHLVALCEGWAKRSTFRFCQAGPQCSAIKSLAASA
jgi:hypothetical protein